MAELLEGVWRASNPSRENARINSALNLTPVIYADQGTLTRYGQLSARLRRTGRPIPINDLWNAALALQHDVPLLADDAHFARVPGLELLPVR